MSKPSKKNPKKKEAETSGYKPEYVHFRELLKKSASEILDILIKDPIFLANACIKKLKDADEDNYVISPILIEHIMMAVRLGSEGETANEIVTSLRHTALDFRELRRTAKALIHVLWEDSIYEFFPASKIFVRSLHTINMNFKIMSEGAFYIYVDLLNFRRPVRATNIINNWIMSQTASAVNGLIARDLLNLECKIVIVSSVYFAAAWHVDIDRKQTSKKNFKVSGDRVVQAEFMHTLSQYNYYESKKLKAKFLELKLVKEQGSLVIVVPTEQNTVAFLEQHLADIFAIPESAFRKEEVRAEVPKYIISTTRDWKDTLQELGITRLFTEGQAEITGIAGKPDDLHVNHLIQKIVIRIEEAGIETSTVFIGQKFNPSCHAKSRSAKVFKANRPFMFYVKLRGVVVFIGRLVDPSNCDDVI